MGHQVVGTEIVGEAFALILCGRVQQPHQQEERHHRGNEIGVCDFPGAAVMAFLAGFVSLDDHSAAGALFAAFARHGCLRNCSTMAGKP